MVVEREARRADRLQHRIAQHLPVVEFFAVGGLEQHAAQGYHLKQQAIAGFDNMIVALCCVRQVRARRLFAGDDFGVAGQGR